MKFDTTNTMNLTKTNKTRGEFRFFVTVNSSCFVLKLINIPSYIWSLIFLLRWKNRIADVMVSVLASSVVDRGFEPRLGQTKDFQIGICCFSARLTALRRKSKDQLARNQNNVPEWSDMSHRGLFFSVSQHKKTIACWSRIKWTSSLFH